MDPNEDGRVEEVVSSAGVGEVSVHCIGKAHPPGAPDTRRCLGCHSRFLYASFSNFSRRYVFEV